MLKQTPLNGAHRRLGARMVDFAGWDMPVQYQGPIPEHLAVRRQAGLFDVSHMGEIRVNGPDATAFLQRITSNDVSQLADGQIHYSALLYPQGTFVDDLLVYRYDPRQYLLVVNAGNRDKDFAYLQQNRSGDVELTDVGDEYVQLAIQGPRAEQILQRLTPVELAEIRYYWFTVGPVDGIECIVSRTGYTGEDGFEIYYDPRYADQLWTRLLETGAAEGLAPCGLAARNTLRLEAKMALYGHDIDATTTVLEADLGWILKLDKGEFVGRDVLSRQKSQGVSRRLVGFEVTDRGIARDHYPIFYDGRKISEVSSGSPAPFLKKNIGLAYLPSSLSRVGTQFEVQVRDKRLTAQVVKTPFYKRQEKQ